MKRFIVVLVLLAGGLAAAALTIPTNAATVNGSAISQNLLNADITAIANSRDYQCYLNAQAYVESQGQQLLAPVDGVGQTPGSGMHPTATTAFVAPYVDTEISHVMVANLAAQRGLQPTAKEVDAARSELSTQISQTMSEVSQVPKDEADQVQEGEPVLDFDTAVFADEIDATGDLLGKLLRVPKTEIQEG